MSQELATRESFNDELTRFYNRRSHGQFDDVIVLLIYWKDSDISGFRDEADQLASFFETRFKYTIFRFEIPSTESFFALNDKVLKIIQQYNTPSSLILIHYGGHGDEDADSGSERLRRGVWAARGKNGPTVNWSDIQPLLHNSASDFLVILDCYFGAQAARDSDSRIIPPNVELVAAAPMGCKTSGPGPRSFTTAFMKEVSSTLERDGYVEIRKVHHSLARRETKLFQTPIHFSHGKKPTLRLEPLSPPEAIDDTLQRPQATLMLRMMLRNPLDRPLLDELILWLTCSAPRDIYGVDVTELGHRASSVQSFMERASSSPQAILNVDSLPVVPRDEVRSAWISFQWSLHDLFRSLSQISLPKRKPRIPDGPSTTNSASDIDDEARVRKFLQEFDDNITSLERVIERNTLAVPELSEEASLSEAIADSNWRDRDLVKALELRLKNIRFEKTQGLPSDRYLDLPPFKLYSISPDTMTCEEHADYGKVLIEHLPLPYSEFDEVTKARNKERMDHLVDLLRTSSEQFRTLYCIAWETGPQDSGLSLIFKPPYDGEYLPVSLFDIIAVHCGQRGDKEKAVGPIPQPTLGQRFKLAKAIGQAILRWHTVGWVHQGISSRNIVLFKHRRSCELDYSKPYLCGFGFTRLISRYSNPRQTKDDVIRDLYQHPERQGYRPLNTHRKEHDIYSFGALLFEIGVWDLLPLAFATITEQKRVNEVQEKMVGHLDEIERDMGLSYGAATRICLLMQFDIQQDDKMQSALAREFDLQVLRKLDAGTHLDAI